MNYRARLWAMLLCCSWLGLPALAQDTPQPAQQQAAEPQAAPSDAATPTDGDEDEPARTRHHVVNFWDNAYLGPNELADELIAVGGSVTSEGEVKKSVVAVFGNTHVTGSVGEDAVAVFGDLYVNGEVDSEAVAVMGNVTLGPKAVVNGDITSIGGTVTVDPAAVVRGDIEQVSSPFGRGAQAVVPWIKHGLLLGRPLAFESGFGWAWQLALTFLGLYVLMGLVFQRPLTECAKTFETAPAQTIFASLATVFLKPLVVIMLLVSVIGTLLLPFLWIGLLFGSLFGKAAVLGALGRRLTSFVNAGPLHHIAFCVLLGGVIMLALYATPFVGFIAFFLFGVLGQGLFVYWLLLKMRASQARRSAERAARVNLAKPAAAATAQPTPEPIESEPAEPLPFLGLPRAGFWIRIAALLVDLLIVGIVVGVLADDGDILPIALAGYGALMWKLKGTTVGGTLCNLQIVRLDGREMDWPTALVRALSCFLSVVAAGLGFFWIAFDKDRQAWHDKIAGTVVVRTERTVALV